MNEKTLDVKMQIKELDAETGVFVGFASTFGGSPDAYGDVIEKGAFTKTIKENGYGGNGIKMLWQHQISEPIGVWETVIETEKGLEVIGKIATGTSKGSDVYELLKVGAVNTLSIGYNEVDVEKKEGFNLIKSVDLFEISLVTFPANSRATINQVKAVLESDDSDTVNIRGLEKLLRDANGFSREAAKYVIHKLKEGNFQNREVLEAEKLLTELDKLGLKLSNLKKGNN